MHLILSELLPGLDKREREIYISLWWRYTLRDQDTPIQQPTNLCVGGGSYYYVWGLQVWPVRYATLRGLNHSM